MHALDLPRTYRTIYICDYFGIGGHRHQDQEALRRFHRHLEPGGALVFSYDVSYAHAPLWRRWLEDERRQLPEGWPASGDRRQGSDGSEYELKSRMVDLDPLEQRLTLEIRATQRRDGEVVVQEDHVLRTNLYFRNELLLMLEAAGYGRVTVYGGYSEAAASANSTMLVFVAEK